MYESDRVCEVAVHTGDVGRHAGACDRVSRCEYEWNGKVQNGPRGTQVRES